MTGLELVVLLGLLLLVGALIGEHTPAPTPLIWIGLGVAAGFVPGANSLSLQPDIVLPIFLPALLYWESLNTSLREIRANFTGIALLAVGLVVATAAVVATVAHSLGISWPVALALGAILSPTDATAVATFARKLPRRARTVLRAESLVNDGTALVLFGIAMTAIEGGRTPDPLGALGIFLYSCTCGIAIGAICGLCITALRRCIGDRRYIANLLSVLTPFVAYLAGQAANASGVVAVVVTGLTLSRFGPRVISAKTRMQVTGFWQLTTYILNGTLFVLIGFEFHRVVEHQGLGWPAIAIGLASACALMVLRMLWVVSTPVFAQLAGRMRGGRAQPWLRRSTLPIAWAGFRGAVSLAAALALPATGTHGYSVAQRNLVVTATLLAIVVVLLVQGLTMPLAMRIGRSRMDDAQAAEELFAERSALQAELAALQEAEKHSGAQGQAIRRLEETVRLRLERIRVDLARPAEARRLRNDYDTESDLRISLIPVKRAAVVRLRDAGIIDDTVLRIIQRRLDLEELRLTEAASDE